MSELEKKLVAKAINKKQVVAVILIAGFLVSFFTFSIFLTKSLLGSQRPLPSENLENSEEEDAELIMPPYPFDLEDLMELFENMSQDQQEELAESLADMMDGNIDDLDLLKYGALIGALLFSNVEKFTVYDYDEWNAENLSKILWKYETYDIFNGTSWKTSATKSDSNFYSYDNYTSEHSDADIMQLKMPLSPKVGINSFVLPSRFPTPFIMEDSLSVNNINPGSVRLYRDDFNSSTLDLEFYSDAEVNMYYELFGLPLPSNEEVNNSAVGEEYTPESIQDQYLQLPPDVNGYIEANPYFQTHYNALDDIIETDDNAFEIANKIRNYMQVNFELSMDARNNDPPKEGEDIVEWFCEHEEGVYSDFASAYCAFTRAFGVASRFVDGFNSRNIEEEFDESEGKNSFVIRYRNIYNWAEIYVPTETSGQGSWVQIDILFETFGAGGQIEDPPELPSSYYLNLETEKEVYERGEQANITATLISPTDPVEDQTIRFRDNKTGVSLGSRVTDYWGRASLLLDVDDTFDVGPKFITAEYMDDTSVSNITNFIVDGNVSVFLNEPQPSEMNRTLTNYTTLSGYAYDPLTGSNLSNALINLSLYLKDTNTLQPYAFNPSLTYTDSEGNFSETVQVDSYVGTGEFKVRADFNGSWTTVQGNTYPNINASSNYQDFNITEKINYFLYFYVNNYSSDFNEDPVVSRGENITLKALLITEYGDPVSDKDISFYDDSIGLIKTSTTNSSGVALYNYTMNNNNIAGPNYIYAQYASLKNSSYYILDEPVEILLTVCPSERNVSRSSTSTSDIYFDVAGTLNDKINGAPIKNGETSVHMYNLLGNEVPYMITSSENLQSDAAGSFSATFRMDPSTPLRNYTLQVHFNGTFDYSIEEKSHTFYLNSFNNFSYAANGFYELKVYDEDDISIEFIINGSHTRESYDDINPPLSVKNGEQITLEGQVNQSGAGVESGTLKFYDYYYNQTDPFATNSFISGDDGYYSVTYTPSDWHSGLHRIFIRWSTATDTYDTYNETYIIINESVDIITNDPPSNTVIRNTESFDISGKVQNGSQGLYHINVSINVFDESGADASSYFDIPNKYFITSSEGDFSFNVYPYEGCPRGLYRFRIDFNGSVNDSPDVVLKNNIYMPHNSSKIIEMSINASTSIQPDTYWTEYEYIDPDKWLKNDIFYANGTLNWDNGTEIVGVNITVSVYDKNDLDNPIAVNKTVKTDSSGIFKVSLKIDDTWPTYRDDTVIKVSYNPYQSDKVLEYTESSESTYS